MSRLTTLLICLAVALLVVACSGQTPTPENATPAVTDEATVAATDEAVEEEATTEATEEVTEEATVEATEEAAEEATPEATVEATEEVTATAEATATEAAADAPSPFTEEVLANMEYSLEHVGDEPVMLTDGTYEDAANMIHVAWIDTYAVGTLNDQPAAAVVLIANTGGSGTFSYLAVVLEENGEPVNVATTLLGDRVTMNWISIGNNDISLDLVTQGPEDAMCCATQRTELVYVLGSENQLENTSTTVIGVQDQISQTVVITYVPEIIPETTQTGSCFANAIGLGRTDAWRCTTEDNVIHDPCFEVDDAPTIVCDADPVTGATGFVLELSEPLPTPDPGSVSNPWIVQLANGKICGLSTGTIPGTADETAPFACADKEYTYLMEEFLIFDPVWFAQNVAFDLGDQGFSIIASTRTPVATVWR